MTNLAIIHFAPLELYPPIQNLLQEISLKLEVQVFTTSSSTVKLKRFEKKGIKIFRAGTTGKSQPAIWRYLNYVRFYTVSFILLMRYRPGRILYFETLSSFPAYCYKRFINKRVQLYIHYHEYTSPEEYETGMKLTAFFYGLEQKMYAEAQWVSHTNSYRLNHFSKDVLPLTLANLRTLPNYPPRNWFVEPKALLKFPINVVYAGALSLTNMYTHEFAEWVIAQGGNIFWHIYSYNHSPDVINYLQNLKSNWIIIHDGVEYDQLAQVLQRYDVGVILYKGHIPNYVYNLPNKLFEYLACGLDVWFPDVMIASLEMSKEEGFPKILSIDFSNLKNFKLDRAMQKRESKNVFSFSCDQALGPLIQKLSENI